MTKAPHNLSKSNQESQFQTPDGKAYEVPVEGSLGLLALGYVGLKAWREKRQATGYTPDQHLVILAKNKTG